MYVSAYVLMNLCDCIYVTQGFKTCHMLFFSVISYNSSAPNSKYFLQNQCLFSTTIRANEKME